MKPQLKTVTSGDQSPPVSELMFPGSFIVPCAFIISVFFYSTVILGILVSSSFAPYSLPSAWHLTSPRWEPKSGTLACLMFPHWGLTLPNHRPPRQGEKALFLLPDHSKLYNETIWWLYWLLFNGTSTCVSPGFSKLFWATLNLKFAFSLPTENVQEQTGLRLPRGKSVWFAPSQRVTVLSTDTFQSLIKAVRDYPLSIMVLDFYSY